MQLKLSLYQVKNVSWRELCGFFQKRKLLFLCNKMWDDESLFWWLTCFGLRWTGTGTSLVDILITFCVFSSRSCTNLILFLFLKSVAFSRVAALFPIFRIDLCFLLVRLNRWPNTLIFVYWRFCLSTGGKVAWLENLLPPFQTKQSQSIMVMFCAEKDEYAKKFKLLDREV